MLKRNLAILALIAVLGFLAVYPMAMLLYGSLHSTPPGIPGSFNLDGYRQVFTAGALEITVNTLILSFVKTALSLLLAISLAWIVARTDTPGRGALEVLLTLPFFIPPVVTATAWMILGNPQVGGINVAWRWLTGSSTPLVNVYSYAGVVWHMMQYSTSFMFLLLVEAFRAMDPALEESSRMSGATRWQTFRRVTLVLMLPITTSAFILSFIRGVESFESPMFFGTPANIFVITTEIFRAINVSSLPKYQYATALAFFALALTFLLILLQMWLLRGRSFHTVTGKGYSPGVVRLGRLRWVSFGFCMLVFFLWVVLPVGQLVAGSFFRFIGFYRVNMLTLEHYRMVLANEDVWGALANTMLLGLMGASATMVLGGIVAYVTVRTRWRGRKLIEAIAWLPWMMPGMVLVIGLLWAYALLPNWIHIYGTIWALLLAYVTLATPLSVRIMSGAYAQLAMDLEECSRVMGANWWQTLWRILIALSWPSFVVGWILVFFSVVRELSASILLYSAGSRVLSVEMLRMWTNGKIEQLTVVSLIVLLLVLLFRWVQLKFIQTQVRAL